MNRIELPLFLRQFTCKKTVEKIKLADIPYTNNSFLSRGIIKSPLYPNPKSIQNRSAHAERNEQSLVVKVNLDSSPDPSQDPKQPESPGRTVPDEPISEPSETNEKSNSEQGLVFCLLFHEHVLRFSKILEKIYV